MREKTEKETSLNGSFWIGIKYEMIWNGEWKNETKRLAFGLPTCESFAIHSWNAKKKITNPKMGVSAPGVKSSETYHRVFYLEILASLEKGVFVEKLNHWYSHGYWIWHKWHSVPWRNGKRRQFRDCIPDGTAQVLFRACKFYLLLGTILLAMRFDRANMQCPNRHIIHGLSAGCQLIGCFICDTRAQNSKNRLRFH